MLKYGMISAIVVRRTPHGVRGLKSDSIPEGIVRDASHPSRGAWIEIGAPIVSRRYPRVAPLTGCVD